MYDKNEFGTYLVQLREEQNISMDSLCKGLCDISMLSRFEHGKRLPEKLLQERFLTRLGVPMENHEQFLGIEDFARWQKRQNIVYSILNGKFEAAEPLLAEYKKEYPMEQPLEEQFYLAMLGQVRQSLGGNRQELGEIFSRAVSLTVPDFEEQLAEYVLSMEEINLVMETLRYCEQGTVLKQWKKVLSYIEDTQKTSLARAKLYPKAVYYCYVVWMEQQKQNREEAEELFDLCNKAIELLRDANRMFYLWELFNAKEVLLTLLYGEQEEEKIKKDATCNECREWKETLETMYERYGVSKEMKDFCYLYMGAETYCIGDIIRIRRKMLGLTIKQLCEGICSERTVSRLENKKMEAHWAVVAKLLERLKLSSELIRKEIVTSSHEMVLKYDKLKDEMNNHRIENAEQLLGELQEQLKLKIPLNRQELQRNRLGIKYYKGELGKQEYAEQMKEVLEYTLPFSTAIAEGKKYLTHVEVYCLRNMARGMDEPERSVYKRALQYICEEEEYRYRSRLHDFICGWIASETGNQGDYDLSDEMELARLKQMLLHRKISSIHEALYSILWNNAKRQEKGKKKTIPRLPGEQEGLGLCISLSSLGKDTWRLKLIRENYEKVFYTSISFQWCLHHPNHLTE